MGRSRPGEAAWLDEHLAGCARALGRRRIRGGPPGACGRCATTSPSRRATCGRGRPRPSSASHRRRGGAAAPRDRFAPTASPPLGVLSGIAVIAVVIGATRPVRRVPPGTVHRDRPRCDAPGRGHRHDPATPGRHADRRRCRVGRRGSARRPTARSPTTSPTSTRSVRRIASRTVRRSRTATPRHVDISIRRSRSRSRPVNAQAVVVGDGRSGRRRGRRHRPADRRPHGEADREADRRHRRPRPTPTADADAERRTLVVARPRADRIRHAGRDAGRRRRPDAEPTRSSRPPSPTPVPTPVVTPTPTAAIPTNLAIVNGVKVVGESAAFSPDGAWFAFTARPSTGAPARTSTCGASAMTLARQLTDDHASVFGSWAGDRVVGSRPSETDDRRRRGIPSRSSSIRPAARRPPSRPAAGAPSWTRTTTGPWPGTAP